MTHWIERQNIPRPPSDGLVLVSSGGHPVWTTPALAFVQVDYYADLPDPTLHTNEIYYVRNSSGVWMINRKSRGFYRSNGIEWQYGGELVDAFSSANFQIYDSVDSSKYITVNVGGLTTGRLLTFPDRDINFEILNNGIVLLSLVCDASVLVGDAVYLDSSGVLKQAIASSMTTSQVVGIVEAKSSLTACNLRINGFTSPFYTGLVPGSRYFLSSTTAGALTSVAPTGSGKVVVEAGVARTSTSAMISPKIVLIRG